MVKNDISLTLSMIFPVLYLQIKENASVELQENVILTMKTQELGSITTATVCDYGQQWMLC